MGTAGATGSGHAVTRGRSSDVPGWAPEPFAAGARGLAAAGARAGATGAGGAGVIGAAGAAWTGAGAIIGRTCTDVTGAGVARITAMSCADLGRQRLGAGGRRVGPLDGHPRAVVRLGQLLAEADRVTTARVVDAGQTQRGVALRAVLQEEQRGREDGGPADRHPPGAGIDVAGDRRPAERGDDGEDEGEPTP